MANGVGRRKTGWRRFFTLFVPPNSLREKQMDQKSSSGQRRRSGDYDFEHGQIIRRQIPK